MTGMMMIISGRRLHQQPGAVFPQGRHGTLFIHHYGFTGAILGLLFLLISVANAKVAMSSTTPDEYHRICTSTVCNETAKEFLNGMSSRNELACQNFYRYACEKFINNNNNSTTSVMEDHQTQLDGFILLKNQVQKQLAEILKTRITSNDRKALKLAKNFYQSCMKTEKIEQTGFAEIKDKIKSLGGWPIIDDSWNETSFDFLNFGKKLLQLGFSTNFIFSLDASFDVYNSTGYTLRIKRPPFYLDPNNLKIGAEDPKVKAYLKYMTAIAKAFGANKDEASLAEEMSQVLQFEIQLADRISVMPANCVMNSTSNIRQMRPFHPNVTWLAYITELLPKYADDIASSTVIIEDAEYLSKLDLFLARTPKRTIMNYIMSNVVLNLVPYLMDERIRQLELAYRNEIAGGTKLGLQPRSSECIEHVHARLRIAIGSVYLREHLNTSRERYSNAIIDVIDIVRHLKETFIHEYDMNFEKADLKTQMDQAYLLAKLIAMTNNVAYPKQLLNDTKLEQYYQGLELSENSSFFENALTLIKFDKEKSFRKISTLADRSDWTLFSDATATSPFYMIHLNAIHIPAAMMQGSFFNEDRPNYVNYGGLGTLVSDEIARAIDLFGIEYNKDGIKMKYPVLSGAFFWNRMTSHRQCLEKHVDFVAGTDDYNNLMATIFTDGIGVRMAYNAYMEWIEEHGEEDALPDLGLTPKKLFWLSSARMWCTKTRSNSPTLAENRVNLALRNSPEFAETYNCPVNSPMNPLDRCPPLFSTYNSDELAQ